MITFTTEELEDYTLLLEEYSVTADADGWLTNAVSRLENTTERLASRL
ncbi:hypothetical protein Pla123a_19370 [Posidoniimonas polymericola]|uniref:Uncharacterized protein n=1 Tax=Posidoniimonas polymericola TaxID=2528002 RepID=A0A5C5YRD6_9BACT|nr:hypothetical protein [Posidoniimonas polymericola]TWT77280.1 hypothetical protein Pla123a_19370 [Posidoniimonas polymericola]